MVWVLVGWVWEGRRAELEVESAACSGLWFGAGLVCRDIIPRVRKLALPGQGWACHPASGQCMSKILVLIDTVCYLCNVMVDVCGLRPVS